MARFLPKAAYRTQLVSKLQRNFVNLPGLRGTWKTCIAGWPEFARGFYVKYVCAYLDAMRVVPLAKLNDPRDNSSVPTVYEFESNPFSGF